MDLDASARTHRALLRKRGVRSAADLLHLALLYGPGQLSLRAVASQATEAGIAEIATSRCSTGCAILVTVWPMCWTICWSMPAASRPRIGG